MIPGVIEFINRSGTRIVRLFINLFIYFFLRGWGGGGGRLMGGGYLGAFESIRLY